MGDRRPDGPAGLERGFALAVGSVLLVLGLAGSIGNPVVGRAGTTGVFVTGFGHDLVHLVCGALFLHVGIALTGRQRAYGLVGLGVFFVVTGLLSLLSSDLAGPLRRARPRASTSWPTSSLGVAAIVIGWMGRGVERREYGRSASRPIRS